MDQTNVSVGSNFLQIQNLYTWGLYMNYSNISV